MFAKTSGNILAIILFLICILVPYYDIITPQGLTRPLSITYQVLSRTLWSMAIGWLIFLCSTNNAKTVNKILSWPAFVPLARLNYSAYLIHSMVIYVLIYNLVEPIHFQPHVLIQYFVSNTLLTYTAAIIIVIFFEAPFFVIEKKLSKQ